MGVNSILTGFAEIQTACREMESNKILIGIVGGASSEVVRIAHSHEYGDGKLPERSFIRASFDADQAALGKIIDSAVNNVLSGKTTPSAAAQTIGARSAQLVQNYIDENKVKPPVSEARQAQKTQYTTLYETGTHIRDRISYEVVSQ
jgi:hypothetical protein